MSPGGSGPYPLQDLCTTGLTAGCVPLHTDSVISGLTLAGLLIRPQLLGISTYQSGPFLCHQDSYLAPL